MPTVDITDYVQKHAARKADRCDASWGLKLWVEAEPEALNTSTAGKNQSSLRQMDPLPNDSLTPSGWTLFFLSWAADFLFRPGFRNWPVISSRRCQQQHFLSTQTFTSNLRPRFPSSHLAGKSLLSADWMHFSSALLSSFFFFPTPS